MVKQTPLSRTINVMPQSLSKAWNLGYRNIMLEIDSLMMIKMLTTNMICLPFLYTFVINYRELLTRSWRVNLQHV